MNQATANNGALKIKVCEHSTHCLPCNFVPQRLAGDNGDLLTHLFVGVEVTAQTGVILLNDDPGGLLDCLGPDPSLRRNQSKTQLRDTNIKHCADHLKEVVCVCVCTAVFACVCVFALQFSTCFSFEDN